MISMIKYRNKLLIVAKEIEKFDIPSDMCPMINLVKSEGFRMDQPIISDLMNLFLVIASLGENNLTDEVVVFINETLGTFLTRSVMLQMTSQIPISWVITPYLFKVFVEYDCFLISLGIQDKWVNSKLILNSYKTLAFKLHDMIGDHSVDQTFQLILNRWSEAVDSLIEEYKMKL